MLAEKCQLSCWNAMLPILSAACLLLSSHLVLCCKCCCGFVHAQAQQGSREVRLDALACNGTKVQLLYQPHARVCSCDGMHIPCEVAFLNQVIVCV